jgi:hypothetical protein
MHDVPPLELLELLALEDDAPPLAPTPVPETSTTTLPPHAADIETAAASTQTRRARSFIGVAYHAGRPTA